MFHYGWRSPGQKAPTTEAQFQKLAGYTMCAIGGMLDPNMAGREIKAPFGGCRHRIIYSDLMDVKGNLQLYWYCDETDIATVKGDGPIATIQFLGDVHFFGRYQ